MRMPPIKRVPSTSTTLTFGAQRVRDNILAQAQVYRPPEQVVSSTATEKQAVGTNEQQGHSGTSMPAPSAAALGIETSQKSKAIRK
jgi:hypothetical protein